MPIKVWDYLKEYELEKEEIDQALTKVFRSGRLILGESVRNFEQELAAFNGRKFGIGVNSGTDALFLALKALGLGPGDEVITVANTAVPTVAAIVSTGATPRFVDIDPRTYLMDTGLLEKAVTPKTRCLLPVHLFGQCVDMDAVGKVARQRGLKVLEDCAQALGATFRGKRAGSMSDIAAHSFYPTKILGAYGDGGMIITDDEALDRKARRLRLYGMETTYYSLEHGYNSRLDEVQAEILRRKLAHVLAYIQRRRALAQRYEDLLRDTPLVLPKTGTHNEHVFYVYVVRHPQRDKIIAELGRREIVVNISYPWPIHTMSGYGFLGGKDGDLPHTEAAAKEIFSLPMYPTLTDDEQDRVSSALHEILASLS